jgi:hypothetical protein
MTDRELRERQEERLYANLFARKMLEDGKINGLTTYLAMKEEEAMHGMAANEVDAVRKRVDRAAAQMPS